ncbi:MAG: hypothetical protein IJT91_08255 [Clostridia bacterium]|nr:hypothetical protein [Clostridia bacterium]
MEKTDLKRSATACLGGFCPVAAFIAVALVSCWWIIPEKNKDQMTRVRRVSGSARE